MKWKRENIFGNVSDIKYVTLLVWCQSQSSTAGRSGE